MSSSKNTLTLSLMTGSIILVLVLQGFWLKSSYNETRDSFSKETGFLFRTTLMKMQDSLLMENIEAIPPDSLFGPDWPGEGIGLLPDKGADSSQIAVMITSDSRRRNTAFPGSHKKRDTRYFVLRQADSLRVGAIEHAYRAALAEAAIDIPFQIGKVPAATAASEMERILPARTLYMGIDSPSHIALSGKGTGEGAAEEISRFTRIAPPHLSLPEQRHLPFPRGYRDSRAGIDHVFLPQTGFISMQFENSAYRWYLLAELAPQLLFSVAMVLFIGISFYFMYRSIRMQQRLIVLKNDFVSNMTHELKTPVATASVAIEALRNFQTLKDPQRTGEYLEIAQNELNRLTLLTDNILKAAIFESKEAPAGVENIDLKEVICQVLASMKLVFEKKQALVSFNTEGEHFQISGGKAHIVNLFYNLLDNALKYSPGKPEIAIRLKSLKGGTLLNISDNGMGIPPEFHKKVFEKFFRVPSGNVHNIKGHGLGLSYVAGIVKGHGGTIRLDSQAGKGSTFIIYLPSNHEKNESTVH